eukprot:TRINITY_DN7114_c0_g4_i1.p1 TRINITY_DN7114_c0_g4~~TRINITY_DN7114_c0_g4_i1.p1  ORF type:complete len:370 (-),score=44.64 TRINITY_DN7114_c0_g4_i1:380-1489(-)
MTQLLVNICLIFLLVQSTLVVEGQLLETVDQNPNDIIQQDISPGCEFPVERVINGDALGQSDRFPYIVALQKWEEDFNLYTHFCGGVLISDSMVVTAAHCIYLRSGNSGGSADLRTNGFNEGPFQNDDIVIAVSPLCRHQGGLGRFKIGRYYIPREYNGRPTNPDGYDIAVLVLEDPLPIEGPFLDYQSANDLKMDEVPMLTLLGYGGVSAGERSTRELYASRVIPLKVGPLSYLDPTVCNQIVEQEDVDYKINEDKVVCAFNENVDACFGDSGGPLIYADGAGQLDIQNGNPQKDVFVGLVSWGPDWACTSITGFPGIYTKVSTYSGWIQSVISREQSSFFSKIKRVKNQASEKSSNITIFQIDQTGV